MVITVILWLMSYLLWLMLYIHGRFERGGETSSWFLSYWQVCFLGVITPMMIQGPISIKRPSFSGCHQAFGLHAIRHVGLKIHVSCKNFHLCSQYVNKSSKGDVYTAGKISICSFADKFPQLISLPYNILQCPQICGRMMHMCVSLLDH